MSSLSISAILATGGHSGKGNEGSTLRRLRQEFSGSVGSDLGLEFLELYHS
jgi:hypothetical protein